MKKENYDVVVIGSGWGGLSAASLLANRGYRTLVVEKLPTIGGRCSVRDYKGFKVSTGAIAVEQVIEDYVFKEIGVPFDVQVPHPQFVYYIDGKPHALPDKGKLRAAITISSGKEEADKIMNVIRRAITWQIPSDSISFYDWITQYTQNEKTLGIFDANWPIQQIPAGQIFRMLKEIGPMFVGYATKGNLVLLESLADVVRANGDVWTRSQAKQIVVEDGLAKKVIIENRQDKSEISVECKAVVSNTGPKQTVKLAGRENYDRGYLKELEETMRVAGWTEIQLSSDGPLVEHAAFAQVNTSQSRRLNWICCPTLTCKDLAPEGKHLTYIGGWLPDKPPYDLDNLEKELELNMLDAKDLIPGLEERAEILHVGFFVKDGCPMYHSWFGYSMPQKTPIENLYDVGDGVFPSGTWGVAGCAASGRVVADDIQSRIKVQ